MDKIFHVFVSSTYTDLIDERKKVSEAVAKAGYVAEGMEIFPASSQKQMNFIKRVLIVATITSWLWQGVMDHYLRMA